MPNGYPVGTILICDNCGCRVVVEKQENSGWRCPRCGPRSQTVCVKGSTNRAVKLPGKEE